MKKIAPFFVACSLVVLLLLAGVCGWYGYFSTVAVQEKPIGPFLIVYRNYIGPPADAGSIIEEIHHRLSTEFKISSLVDFGLYYDDPAVMDPNQCRALIGCVIEKDQEGDLHALSEKYTIATIPRGMAVVADYPYKNKLSILFGALKGYPALLAYGETHHLEQKPVLALYDARRGRIRYAQFTAFETSFFDSYLMLE